MGQKRETWPRRRKWARRGTKGPEKRNNEGRKTAKRNSSMGLKREDCGRLKRRLKKTYEEEKG